MTTSCKVVLFKGRGLISGLIRWQTRSEYSHAALLIGGDLYESREGKGVQCLPNWTPEQAGCAVDVFEVAGLDGAQVNAAWLWLWRELGKKYDWTMVVRFVTRRQASRRSSGKWFCSELVFAWLQKAGVTALRATEPWEVSPGMLGRSPLLGLVVRNGENAGGGRTREESGE